MIVVEQLNPSQWHAIGDHPEDGVGVGDYVHVLAMALILSALLGGGLESVDLHGGRLVLVREEARHG